MGDEQLKIKDLEGKVDNSSLENTIRTMDKDYNSILYTAKIFNLKFNTVDEVTAWVSIGKYKEQEYGRKHKISLTPVWNFEVGSTYLIYKNKQEVGWKTTLRSEAIEKGTILSKNLFEVLIDPLCQEVYDRYNNSKKFMGYDVNE